MLPEKLRSIFRKGSETVSPAGVQRTSVPGSLAARHSSTAGATVTRQSRGLEQFFFNIRDVVGLSILDTAGASQENISYLTGLGHKPFCHDMVRSLDGAFGKDPAAQTNVSLIEAFLRNNFDYAADTFDGVLLWDSLQFMGPALLAATVERLAEIMRPQAYLLAYFTANERLTEVPSHTFRIVDNKTVSIIERSVRTSGQVFNNRNLERLFGKFESVKFFLTRESLREVIVKR